MNRNRPLALLLAAMFLLAGCSREGFEASLSRADKSSAPQAQSSRPEQAGAVYELEELTAEESKEAIRFRPPQAKHRKRRSRGFPVRSAGW